MKGHFFFGVAVALVFLGGVHGVTRAELTPMKVRRAHDFIGLFAAREFVERQQAVQRLMQMGPDVLPLVRKTLAETRDPKVKRCCEMVIQSFEGPKMEGPIRLEASRVTIDVTNRPFGEVVELLQQQSGNRPIDMLRDLSEKRITFSVKDTPYWQALDALAKVGGAVYGSISSSSGRGRLILKPAPNVVDVGAYAGPAVIKVRNATRTIQFRPARYKRPGVLFGVGYLWEDRLPIFCSEVWVDRVTTPDGRPLPFQGRAAKPTAMEHTTTRGGLCSAGFSLFLQTPPKGLKKLGTIEGRILLECGTGKGVLKIDDVLADVKKTATAGDRTLKVEKTRTRSRSTTVTLQVTFKGKAFWPTVTSGDDTYGIFLVDGGGKRYRGMIAKTDPSLSDKHKRLADIDAGKLPRNHVERFGVAFRFTRLPRDTKRWALVWVYPQTYALKAFPFEIRDVPVP